MRGGICTVQQALTPEATAMVKQAVAVARRRGHAQVTPLHVASAMLATSAGLLRRACMQCDTHPLQCKALELCFNVALNRLPASSPSPLVAQHYTSPSFSNALVAAFKRAQAHQRRGSAENQQQPILALKIELEQLVISILDDPSVSRVMREAGFSSPLVKSRVEQAVSLEVCSAPGNITNTTPKEASHAVPNSKPFEMMRREDVGNVLSVMLNKRKNTVIVGECLASAENVARGVMESFERGNNVGYGNSFRCLQFVNLPLFSLRNISKEEVEQKLAELRCVVKGYMGRGVVFYLGDLTWVSEFWSSCASSSSSSFQRRSSSYFALEQVIMELKRLVSGENSGTRVWLMGISTFQTYMKCKAGNPSLETLWELHPLTIPVGSSLSLSLKYESDVEADVISIAKASKDIVVVDEKHISCCTDHHCSFDDHKHNANSSTTSNLPSWLQKYRDENKRSTSNSHHQEYCITVGDLCKKWNSFCSPGQKHPHFAEKHFNFTSLSPSSNTFSSHDFNHAPPNKQSPKEYQFWVLENNNDDQEELHGYESNVKMFMPGRDRDIDDLDNDHEPAKPELLSNPNSSPNSASSSEVIMDNDDDEGLQSFKELNAENLRILCDEMEKDVPWQKEIIPEIATTVLQCRSGMSQRKSNVLKCRQCEKEDNCWLFFLGADSKGKEKIARTLAKLIFGSQNNSFVSIGLSSFSSSTTTRADSSEECPKKHKRTRDELGCSYVQRLGEAMNENPRRVFFMEDLEEVDQCSQKGIKKAIETGKITLPCGETVPLKDSIVIFSCDSFATSGSRASSPKRSPSQKSDQAITKEKDQQVSLDLNIAVLHDDHGCYQDDGHEEDSDSFNVGILESVDRKFVFQVQQ